MFAWKDLEAIRKAAEEISNKSALGIPGTPVGLSQSWLSGEIELKSKEFWKNTFLGVCTPPKKHTS